ncbi:hypothetical protein Vafri_21426, partial [Volvox africanus]
LGELTALRSLAIVRAAPAASTAASSRAVSYSSGYHTWRPMLPEAWRETVTQVRKRALNEFEYGMYRHEEEEEEKEEERHRKAAVAAATTPSGSGLDSRRERNP